MDRQPHLYYIMVKPRVLAPRTSDVETGKPSSLTFCDSVPQSLTVFHVDVRRKNNKQLSRPTLMLLEVTPAVRIAAKMAVAEVHIGFHVPVTPHLAYALRLWNKRHSQASPSRRFPTPLRTCEEQW